MRVFSYVMTLAGDRHEAEEITQETFFRALSGRSAFRGESDEATWLCAIAKNLWLSERRRAEPLPLEELPETAEQGGGPEERALEREDALRVFGQLGFREIGELFGKTENWACVVYHRARGKLRAEMEETK